MHKKVITSLFFLISLQTGCASYDYTDAPPTLGVLYSRYAYIGYPGDIKSMDKIGVVTTDGLIKVVAVDGQSTMQLRRYREKGFYSGGRFQLHLLPGRHVLTLGFHDDRGSGTVSWSAGNVLKAVEIKEKQVIHLALSISGQTWTAKEMDGSRAWDAIVSDFNELSRQQTAK